MTILKEYHYFIPPNDLLLFLAYYDLDRDGRISLHDFTSVLLNKLD